MKGAAAALRSLTVTTIGQHRNPLAAAMTSPVSVPRCDRITMRGV